MMEKMNPAVRTVIAVALWILALIAALYPGRYINNAFGYLAFFFLLLLLILSLIILFTLKRRLLVETNMEGRSGIQCLRGEPVDLDLQVKNNSIFFCPHARGGFYISDLFGGVDAAMNTDFTIAPRSGSDFDFDMDMRHIGEYHVGIRDLKVYDMFGFFRIEVPISGDFDVYVKPRIYSMEEMKVEEEVFLESDRETRRTVPSGVDYVGVRDYEPGDPMKQIHWKLSAHTFGYLTKISENNRQSDYAVIPDFSANPADKEELMDLYDTIVEMAFSILEELSHREVSYSMVYCDKQLEMRRSIPRGREYDMEYIRRFDVMRPDPVPGYPDGAHILNQEARMPNRSTNLILCTSRITTELVQEMISIKRQGRKPEMYFVFPERLDRREREDLMAPLLALDDAGVSWTAVSTARNLRPADARGEGEEES